MFKKIVGLIICLGIISSISMAETNQEYQNSDESIVALDECGKLLETIIEYKIESADTYNDMNRFIESILKGIEEGHVSMSSNLKYIAYNIFDFLNSDVIDFSSYEQYGDVESARSELLNNTNTLIQKLGEISSTEILAQLYENIERLEKDNENRIESSVTYVLTYQNISRALEMLEIEQLISNWELQTLSFRIRECILESEYELKRDGGIEFAKKGEVEIWRDVLKDRSTELCLNTISENRISVMPSTPDGQTVYSKYTMSERYTEMYVKHGTHTYGCDTQEKYDLVMEKIEFYVDEITRAWSKRGDTIFAQSYIEDIELIESYLNGDLLSKGDRNEVKELLFSRYQGLELEEIRWVNYAHTIYNEIVEDTSVRLNKAASLYDYFFEERQSDLAKAYLQQAIYDSIPFTPGEIIPNTRIVRNDDRIWCEVEINGIWYSTDGGVHTNYLEEKEIIVNETYSE